MSEIHSYSSIYNLGHRLTHDLLADPVVVEEKIDGSQFSFGVVGGELRCRSKGQQLVLDAPEKMFALGVENVKAIHAEVGLVDGWTYRGEYLNKPKHNTLCYARTPARNVILFDIDMGDQSYLNPTERAAEAARLGLEVVPTLHHGRLDSVDQVRGFLAGESCLGGTKPEGVVVKNHAKFGQDKKVLMAKFVTDDFRERNGKEFRRQNPTHGDIIAQITESYRAEGRWRKAVHHLRDAGTLEGSPRDIGALIKEVPADVLKECREEIMEALFKEAWPKIARGITNGLPQWYKDELAKSAVDSTVTV